MRWPVRSSSGTTRASCSRVSSAYLLVMPGILTPVWTVVQEGAGGQGAARVAGVIGRSSPCSTSSSASTGADREPDDHGREQEGDRDVHGRPAVVTLVT